MKYLNWLAEGKASWHEVERGSLIVQLRLYRQGKHIRVPFKVDTGAATTAVPLDFVQKLLPVEEYARGEQPMGRSDVRGNSLSGMRCKDMELFLHRNALDLEDVAHVGTGLWVSRDMKRCGLLGTDFLERFGLLVLNFPQVEGPYGLGPHFGLLERPGGPLLLEEPGVSP